MNVLVLLELMVVDANVIPMTAWEDEICVMDAALVKMVKHENILTRILAHAIEGIQVNDVKPLLTIAKISRALLVEQVNVSQS